MIDLFAGPGGLGEGFSRFDCGKGVRPFKIKLSIEKDIFAHQTLLLRSFYMQFPEGSAPREYYDFIKSEQEKNIDALLNLFPAEGEAARHEARLAELGSDEHPPEQIDAWIERVDGNTEWLLIGGSPCQEGRSALT